MKADNPPPTITIDLPDNLSGLEADAKNLYTVEFSGVYNANISLNFDDLKPLRTYEQYIRHKKPPEVAEEIIKRSNKANVEKVNKVVAEYNEALPRIKETKNAQLGMDILDRLDKIFSGEE